MKRDFLNNIVGLKLNLQLTALMLIALVSFMVIGHADLFAVSASTGQSNVNTVGVIDQSGSNQQNVPVSIPRFFKKGEIAQYAHPTINGSPASTWQCDVKNRWDDGSLKFAIVSAVIPQLPGKRGVTVGFANDMNRDSGGQQGTATGFLAKSDMLNPAYDFEATMQLSGTASPVIHARDILNAGNYRYWLQGPVVTAVILEDREGRAFDVNVDGSDGKPLHPIFEAWFYPQGFRVQVGFTVENAWASSTATKSARNQDYALVLTTGSKTPVKRLAEPTFTQFAFTRWRREYWVGAEPPAIKYDWNPRYLLTTGAYPNWDTDHIPNEAALALQYRNFNRLNPQRFAIAGYDDIYADKGHGPGGIVTFDQSINAGGDADWIGLANTWDIMYLLTGDLRMRKMMTENADLAGRFPLWFREADNMAGSGKKFDKPNTGKVSTQGRLVSLNSRQQVTLLLSGWHPGCRGEDVDNINTVAPPKSGGWPALDTSHLPDWGYLPYTLTGKYYYLEQLQLEAAYILGFYTGCYDLSNDYWRQGTLGLLNHLQRDQAWAMRTVAYAGYASPDGTPEGPYFRDKLLNTIAMMEGAHGLPNSYPSHSIAYDWGKNTWTYSQGHNPSPLGAWQIDGASLSYATQDVNINKADLRAAGSGFQEAFLICGLGMVRQLGMAETKPLLTFVGKRYLHTLLDPAMNHYLIEEYVYPEQLKAGNRWIPDWATFQKEYLVLPQAWAPDDKSANLRGFYALSAASYLADIEADGYSGQAAWKWFKANKPNQVDFTNVNPKWSTVPFRP